MWPLQDQLALSLPSRVLWITDLDDIPTVLPVAMEYAYRAKAQIRLLHTLGTGKDRSHGTNSVREEALLRRTTQATEILERTISELRSAGVECDWQLENGLMEGSLRKVSDTWGPDRIICAQSCRTFRVGLDANTEIILRNASVPVLVVKPDKGPVVLSRPLKILFPTSLDRHERAAAISVLRFARIHGAEVTMLHVIDDGPDWNSRVQRVRLCADQQFREILADFRGLHAETRIELGDISETVVRIAQQGYDLVLLGVFSGVSFRSDVRPGSAYKILCHAPRPVLVCKRTLPHPLFTQKESELTLVGPFHLPPA